MAFGLLSAFLFPFVGVSWESSERRGEGRRGEEKEEYDEYEEEMVATYPAPKFHVVPKACEAQH